MDPASFNLDPATKSDGFNMRLLATFAVLALIGLVASGPVKNNKLTITKDWYRNDYIKYTAEHDIVRMVVPLNSLNFDESESSSPDSDDTDIILFFVEADIQADGSKQYQGLYVLKEGKAKKILENGRDIAASGDDSKQVFFGATDGLYVYNPETNSADKYGPITDSIISIAKEREGDVLYILTEDNVVYKVTDNGEKKVKVDEIEGAKQIVLDFSNNLYFYSDDKQPWVLAVGEDVKKIEGLPEAKGDVKLVTAPLGFENKVPFMVNNEFYTLYANGTSEESNIKFAPDAVATAFAPDASLIQYYAYDKKIYEYNVLVVLMNDMMDELKNFLNTTADEIEKISNSHAALKRKIQKA